MTSTKGERKRWLLVGNAVSVPVASWIGQGIASRSHRALAIPEKEMGDKEKWPVAASRIDQNSPILSAEVGDLPVARKRIPLMQILEAEPSVVRKPLSRAAASGFLKRFEASRLLRTDPDRRKSLIRVLKKHIKISTS